MTLPNTMAPYFSALGNSVLNSFWQMGLLWLGIIIISKYRKNMSPGVLGSLSFLALTIGFIAFITTFFVSLSTPETDAGLLVWIANNKVLEIIIYYAAAAYLLLLVVPVAKFVTGYHQVHLLRRKRLSRAPGIYKIFMLDAKSYLGIKRKVQLWVSEIAEVPLTIGFFKPIILLPVAMVNNLSTAQVEAVILHELAHIKKNDYLINFIGQLMITVLYFNPFAKALFQIHNLEREKHADNTVLQFEYDHHQYATTLLQLAKQNFVSAQKFTLQASGDNAHLYNRIKWIIDKKERTVPPLKKVIASLGMIVLFLLLSPTLQNIKKTGPVGSLLSNSAPPSITYAAASTEKDSDFEIRQIPTTVAESAVKPVYLKEIENAETGSIEILTPADIPEKSSTALFILAGTPAFTIPKLSPEQEANVQQSISAVKKIFAESNWQQIENSLAESVTANQKAILKEAFKTRINEADWMNQANLLRLEYNSINWEKAKAHLNLDVAYIKLDSIYNHYSTALEKYNAVQQEIKNDSLDEINRKIADTRIILMKADSIRKKRIIEL